MVYLRMKEELKYVIMECGELSVIKDGIKLMATYSVHSWDMLKEVSSYQFMYLLLLLHIIEPIVFPNSLFGAGYYPIVYSHFACGGWETDLADCSRQVYPQSNCSRDHVAGVLCGYGRKNII